MAMLEHLSYSLNSEDNNNHMFENASTVDSVDVVNAKKREARRIARRKYRLIWRQDPAIREKELEHCRRSNEKNREYINAESRECQALRSKNECRIKDNLFRRIRLCRKNRNMS